MDLKKRLTRAVHTILWPYLRGCGFTDFDGLSAWRKGDRWIDCVEIQTIGATSFGSPKYLGQREGHEVLANAATFSLELGCYYTDRHLLPWAGAAPTRPRCPRGPGSRYPGCDRLRSLARSFEYGNIQATLFPVDDEGSNIDEILGDALSALKARGMDWLETAHDIDAFLARYGVPLSSYMSAGEKIDLTEKEQLDLDAWLRSKGVADGEVAFTAFGFGDMPESLGQRFRAASLRDHTSAELPFPSGDLRYALLLGSGRPEEALEALRCDSDPEFAERQYRELIELRPNDRSAKRTAAAIRKRALAILEEQREHLGMLEALLNNSSR